MGVVPQTVGGPYNSPWLVVLLMIVTCGIWGIFWTYRTSEDLKKYNGDGLGGVLGIVIYLLLSVVLMFTIPGEIEKMYQRNGRESPVSPLCGPVVPAADRRPVHLVLQGPGRRSTSSGSPRAPAPSDLIPPAGSRLDYQRTGPWSSKKPPVGPSASTRAIATMARAPSATVLWPEWSFMSVAV